MAKGREQLISTAVQLFAERGLDGVSLAEINRAAGQKNATAAHYHFGGKQGLVQAIFDKHRSRVNQLRQQMLASLPANADLPEIVRTLVVPLAEQVRDPDGGCHYLRFLAQLMNNPRLPRDQLDQTDSEVLAELFRRFELVLSGMREAAAESGADSSNLRMEFVISMVFNSLASYADRVAREGLDESRHSLTVDQLVAAATGALQADT